MIRYQTSLGENKLIQIEKLGLYEFKAPVQWLSECSVSHWPCLNVHYYLCRSLEDFTQEKIVSWRIEERGTATTDHSEGLGVDYTCYK